MSQMNSPLSAYGKFFLIEIRIFKLVRRQCVVVDFRIFVDMLFECE